MAREMFTPMGHHFLQFFLRLGKEVGPFFPDAVVCPLPASLEKQWETLKSKWSMPMLKLRDVGANLPLPQLVSVRSWFDGAVCRDCMAHSMVYTKDCDRQTSHFNMVEFRTLCNFNMVFVACRWCATFWGAPVDHP